MRNTFARTMTQLAQERSDVCLLSGDIGNRMFDEYKKVAPSRFLNCGIAEANMMSMAAGMGMCGLRPVVYTITPFTTVRCLEQIRTGVAYHEAPVVIVGTGSGLSYSELGTTHHSLEDIAVLRSIPGIDIYAPVDSVELTAQLKSAIEKGVPSYIRIGKKGEPNIYEASNLKRIGGGNMIKHGKDQIILGIGPIIGEAIKAVNILNDKGTNVGIASMGCVKPLDNSFLKEEVIDKGYTKIITLEEHYKLGGLGTSIIEYLSEQRIKNIDVVRIGVEDKFIHRLGDQEFTRKELKIDVEGIIERILKG